MALLDRIFAKRQPDEQRLDMMNTQEWHDLGLTRSNASGVSVTPSTAMTHAAVYACVRILAETVASLPLLMYQRLDRGKTRARDHYLYTLLHDQPNPRMTAFAFKETLQGHLALWGNAYAELVYDGAGRVREMWPLRPDRMAGTKTDRDGRLWYYYQLPDNTFVWLPQDIIWHQHGLGDDGVSGYSPISLMRQAIGVGMAAEEFGARFFGNDARPGGVLQHPGEMGDEAYQRLKGSWESRHMGLANSHRVAILEEGMTYQQIGMPLHDAQFLETRKFQIQEIARAFRIPPHMLADLDRATFSNIEHQSIEFVVHTIRPWLVRWEQSISQNLILSRDRDRYYAEFLVDGLLRGDVKSRYEAYSIGRQNGWLSADDIREMENMNPLPDDQGEVYLVPLNMAPAAMVASGALTPEVNGRAERAALPADIEQRARSAGLARQQLVRDHMPLFEDTLGRLVRREVSDVKRNAAKFLKRDDLPGFLLWLEEFYQEHAGFMGRNMAPVLIAYAAAILRAVQAEIQDDRPVSLEEFARGYADTYGGRYTTKQLGFLMDLVRRVTEEQGDLLEAIEGQMDTWDEARPMQEAAREAQRGNNALAVIAYQALSVERKRWTTLRDSCPYCTRLNGKIVSVQEHFLLAGSQVDAEGHEPLPISINMGHPPAHDGCDCMVTAA